MTTYADVTLVFAYKVGGVLEARERRLLDDQAALRRIRELHAEHKREYKKEFKEMHPNLKTKFKNRRHREI